MRIEDVKKLNEIADERIIQYSEERIYSVVKDEVCRDILTNCGIARSVSPYIDFLEEGKGGFDSVSNFIKMHSMEGDDTWDNEVLKKEYIFGFHDNNFIVLTDEGSVKYIHNETFAEKYANKDLQSFFNIVIKFNFMITEYYDENPDGDFFGEGFTDRIIEEFIYYIGSIDENAVNNNTFWDLIIEQCKE